jgi:hypothetical protein
MTRSRLFLCVALGVLGVVIVAPAQDGARVVPFSSASAGSTLPNGWEVMRINAKKKLTQYRFVEDGGKVVLHASANVSASGIAQRVAVDLDKTPVVEWRWKIARLIPGADMEQARGEDSPARIVFTFDGDINKLPLNERATATVAKNLSGQDLPYATLMYVWANEGAVDRVIRNPHTGRVRMIVVESGPADVGKWQTYSRNVREDFKRAFGEYPGRMLTYGVLTDSDNTGESAEAWYGDIVFKPK